MTTLRITNNSPQAVRFIEYAKTLPFVEEEKAVRGMPRTPEELRESVLRAEAEIKSGRTYSMEEVRARFSHV
jgi:hypothetical protein